MEHWDGYVFASHLTPKQHVAVANLVDKKCKVLCLLNGVPVKTLLGHGCTGIHCVEKLAWRLSAFLKVKEYCRLLGEEAGLNLIGANGGLIPFDGWVEVQFRLTSGTQSSTPLTEPLLFARGDLEYPMIGYVIEEVIESPDQMEEDSAESLCEFFWCDEEEVVMENEIEEDIIFFSAIRLFMRREISRIRGYFEVTVPMYELDVFRSHFRMTRTTFELLTQ